MQNQIASLTKNSSLNNLSPGCRLIAAFILGCGISVVSQIPGALLALACSFGVLAAARIPSRIFFKRLLIINLFTLFLWLFVPWSFPGKEVFELCGIGLTEEGLKFCCLLTLKINALFVFFISLVSTLSLGELVRGLKELRFPASLITLLVFMAKGIEELGTQYKKLSESASLRGFVPGTNLHTYRTIASMLAILLLKANLRTEALKEGLMVKGFNGVFTPLKESKWTPLDSLTLLLTVCTAGVILFFGL